MAQCRICLDDSPSENVFSSKVRYGGTVVTCRDIMANLFSLKVALGDGLPSSVCRKCFLKLSSAHRLKILAEESYAKLLERASKTTDGDDETMSGANQFCEVKLEVDPATDDWDDDDDDEDRFEEKVDRIKVEKEFGAKDESANRCYAEKPGKRLKTSHDKGRDGAEAKKNWGPKDGFCDLCGKEFKQLRDHMEKHKLERKQYPCSSCPKIFLSRGARGTHMKNSHLNPPYYCEACKKFYKRGDDHIREKHSNLPTPHECDVCHQKFAIMSKLKVHMTTHTSEKPFLCQICGRAFKSKRECIDHRGRVHDNEKRFECDYCGKRFYSKSALGDHIRVHTKEKRYKCEECGKFFPRLNSLKDHILLHSGQKNEKCHFCDMLFYNKSALSTHMLTHTKEKKHECKYCGTKFSRTDHRNRHERTVHENENQTKRRAVSIKTESDDFSGFA